MEADSTRAPPPAMQEGLLEGLCGMEDLAQAQAKLQGIHRESDEFLSYVVRSFRLDWQAAFVQSMVDLVLEMQGVSAHIARLMQNFEHYIQFSVRLPLPLPLPLPRSLSLSLVCVRPLERWSTCCWAGAASAERGDQLARLPGRSPSW
jgi:hypothetical protein